MKNIFAFLSLVLLAVCPFYASPLKANLSWKLIKSEKFSELRLIITITDTAVKNRSRPSTDYHLSFPQVTKENGPHSEDLKSQILKIVKKNNCKLYINHPAYMDEIFSIFTKESDKNRAIAIYDENNILKSIRIDISSHRNVAYSQKDSANISNKYLEINSWDYEISIPLIVNSSFNFVLDELLVSSMGKEFRTERIEMNIEK